MNIISAIVGLTLIWAAAPSVMNMTLAPVEAQARAGNFSEAETASVAFSAEWEGKSAADWKREDIPENCDDPEVTSSNGLDRKIKCWGGKKNSKYYQEVTRSYRLASAAGASTFSWSDPIPDNIGAHQCHKGDSWGSNLPQGYNALYADVTGACVPRVAWTEDSYIDSDPSKWEYDLRGYADQEGYATHPDFID